MRNSKDTRFIIGLALLVQAIVNLYMVLVLHKKKDVMKSFITTAFVSSIASTAFLFPILHGSALKKRKPAKTDFDNDIDFDNGIDFEDISDDEDIDNCQC